MAIVIIIILIFLLFIIIPCNSSHTAKSGIMYRSRNNKSAEIIDFLRKISMNLSYDINNKDGIKLRQKLQNTTFKELIYQDPNVLGWNYDKGREIGMKLYKSSGDMYSCKEIIDTLFHELAHSLTVKYGHHSNWKEKDDYLKTFSPKYVEILELKISEINKQNE